MNLVNKSFKLIKEIVSRITAIDRIIFFTEDDISVMTKDGNMVNSILCKDGMLTFKSIALKKEISNDSDVIREYITNPTTPVLFHNNFSGDRLKTGLVEEVDLSEEEKERAVMEVIYESILDTDLPEGTVIPEFDDLLEKV